MESAMPFGLRKIGHVVLNVTDLDASVRFYTEVLGLMVSDRYPDSMVPGGMVFLRCNTDHHGVALVGAARAACRWSSRVAGAPGARSPSSSRTPTATTSRSTGTSTRSAPTARRVR